MFSLIKKIIKIIMVLLALIGFLVVYIGFSLKKGIESAVEINPSQEVKVLEKWVDVSTDLTEEKGIVLEDFKICEEYSYFPEGFNYGSICFNKKCTTTLELKSDLIPERIKLSKYINDDKCEDFVIENPEKLIKAISYTGDVGINDATKELLGDKFNDDSLEKTDNSKFEGSNVVSFGDTIISLKYKEKKDKDEFLFGSVLFKVKYK